MLKTKDVFQTINIAHNLLDELNAMEAMIHGLEVLMNPTTIVPSDEILINSLQNQIELLQNQVKTLQYQLDIEREFNREMSWLLAAENEERRRLTALFTRQNVFPLNPPVIAANTRQIHAILK